MKKVLIAAAALAALGVASPVFAQSTYGSVEYSNVHANSFNLDAITGTYGWNPGVVGVEGEASLGVNGDTSGANTGRLNYEVGAYGVAKGQLNPDFAVFGRAGYSYTEAKVNGVTGHDDGLAYGAGVIWSPGGGPNGLRAEYTRHDYNASNADVWSIGYSRRF